MAPGPSFYIVYNLIYLLLIISTPLVTFHYFIHFIIQVGSIKFIFFAQATKLCFFCEYYIYT